MSGWDWTKQCQISKACGVLCTTGPRTTGGCENVRTVTEITIYGRPSSEALEHGFLGLTTGFLLRPIIDTLSVQKHNLHFGLVSYIIYHLFVLNPPVLLCHLRVSGSSARSLSDVFRLAFNIGFVFSHSPSFCPPAIETSTGSYVPAGGGKTERRQTFFFFFFLTFSRQWLSTGTQESTAYFLQCKPDVKQWSMAALLSSKADKCRPKM